MSQKPNVLIFGGLYGLAQALTQVLIPPSPSESLVAHIRWVDKHSVNPPTVYVGKHFLAQLKEKENVIQYKQANLINPAVVAQCFDEPAPNGLPYDYVFDLSGNHSFELPAAVQIMQTLNVGVNIAREAHKHGVRAIVRLQLPLYDHIDTNAKYTEDDEKGWKPLGTRGVWWHETLRAMGSIPGLPFVVLRCGFAYGAGIVHVEAASVIALGLVYKHLGREIKTDWSPKLRKNTVHVQDIATAMWKSAEWMASTGREAANSLAGVILPPTGDPEISSATNAAQHGGVLVPAFHVVDGADTTQQTMLEEIAKVFGIQVMFYEGNTGALQYVNTQELKEHLNDLHVGEWAKIITNSTPPVPRTPLSPYIYEYQVEQHGCALDGNKIRKILDFRPEYPTYDVRGYIKWCREEGIWPETPLYNYE